MRTYSVFLCLNRTFPEVVRSRVYFTLRDLQRQAIFGDYALKAQLIVEDETPVWEAQR